MWVFKLTLPLIDVTDEVTKWLSEIPFKRHIETTIIQSTWLEICGSDFDIILLNHLFQNSPSRIKELLKNTYENNHIYLEAVHSLDPKDVSNAVITLRHSKNFVVSDQWRLLGIKPFESTTTYHKRLVTLIPIQMVLKEISTLAEIFDLDWDVGFKMVYKDMNLDVKSYVDALKYRERRKIIPLIKRLLENCKKIRELRKSNEEFVINTNLQNCK